MQFNLTEDQTMIQESVRRFAESRLGPDAGAWDHQEACPETLSAELTELGLMGLVLDPDHGGSGLDHVAGSVAVEELARRDGASAAWVALHAGTSRLIQSYGTSAQKDTWLSRLAAGETSLGWSMAPITAEVDGDQLRLSGTASFVWLGHKSEAALLWGATDRGPSCFLVPRDTPGLTVTNVSGRMGLRALDVAEWRLDGITLGLDAQIDVPEDGRASLTTFWASVAVGLGRAAFEEAKAYAQDRQQFGKPIAQFQAMQWKLADMATEIDAARLLVYRAADGLDRGRGDDQTVADQALAFSVDAAVRAGYHAVQIFGGNGFVREYPVERILRDAKVVQIAFSRASRPTPLL